MTVKFFYISILSLLLMDQAVYAQESAFGKNSINTGIGIGINAGRQETGLGVVCSFGWQKSFGQKNKLRINPNMLFGEFLPIVITDTRDQFYRTTALALNLHYDLLRYKAVSLVTAAGGFVNYSRGLLGTGGWPEANNNRSAYFYTLYFGGAASFGLRIDPKNKQLSYELRPLNFLLGSKGFTMGYLMFNVDFKLKT
jgi:hypothetical protein